MRRWLATLALLGAAVLLAYGLDSLSRLHRALPAAAALAVAGRLHRAAALTSEGGGGRAAVGCVHRERGGASRAAVGPRAAGAMTY
mgnify:CR=1 FL=1